MSTPQTVQIETSRSAVKVTNGWGVPVTVELWQGKPLGSRTGRLPKRVRNWLRRNKVEPLILTKFVVGPESELTTSGFYLVPGAYSVLIFRGRRIMRRHDWVVTE